MASRGGRVAVDDNQPRAGLPGYARDRRGGLDHEGGADGDQQVARLRRELRPHHDVVRHRLAERDCRRLEESTAPPAGLVRGNVIAAGQADRLGGRFVQLADLVGGQSRSLVQEGVRPSRLLNFREESTCGHPHSVALQEEE